MEGKTVDFKALDLLCGKLECGNASHRATAAQIRKAMNGAERSNDGVDVDALHELANKFDGYSTVPSYESFIFTPRDFNIWSKKIRDAVKGAKPQLPEGIIWPRFEDGELVKFGDEFVDRDGSTCTVSHVNFYPRNFALVSYEAPAYESAYKLSVKRPETEVLDADGVPIKVGDTVWYGHESECTVLCITRYDGKVFIDLGLSGADWNVGGVKPSEVTHRKPDTQEAIDDDLTLPPWKYCERHGIEIESGSDEATTVEAMCRHLLERQRKLMGGE